MVISQQHTALAQRGALRREPLAPAAGKDVIFLSAPLPPESARLYQMEHAARVRARAMFLLLRRTTPYQVMLAP